MFILCLRVKSCSSFFYDICVWNYLYSKRYVGIIHTVELGQTDTMLKVSEM